MTGFRPTLGSKRTVFAWLPRFIWDLDDEGHCFISRVVWLRPVVQMRVVEGYSTAPSGWIAYECDQ